MGKLQSKAKSESERFDREAIGRGLGEGFGVAAELGVSPCEALVRRPCCAVVQAAHFGEALTLLLAILEVEAR